MGQTPHVLIRHKTSYLTNNQHIGIVKYLHNLRRKYKIIQTTIIMKKAVYILLSAAALLGFSNRPANAQNQNFKYRRSSLSMVLIESKSFPNKDAVTSSWNNYPFPDKYNAHDIKTKSLNIEEVKLSDADLLEAGYLKDTLKNQLAVSKAEVAQKQLRYLNDSKTQAVVLPSEKKAYQLKIDKMIKEQKIANQMVATWFDLGDNNKFDMELVQKRGFYNASELEASIAKGQSRGMASLGDAGEELLKNTFVTFTKLEFVENEPIAKAAKEIAIKEINKKMAGKPGFLIEAAKKAAEETYNKAKEGYSLWSKTWLYQLDWNDSIANTFYSTLWNHPEDLMSSDLFKLKFVGTQYNQSLVTFNLGKQRTQEQIIDLALVRNVDNAFAKLQKQNEVFKPKVPVLSTHPITAQIGMKEGLKGGEKFEVLEMTYNSKTGHTEYKVIGTATVNKKHVWDNRYNAGEESNDEMHATPFKGSKKIQPGMLLKLKK